MATPLRVRPREDAALSVRLARSATVREHGAHLRTSEVHDWLARRRAAYRFAVERVPLDALEEWATDPVTGNLTHSSGRFFSVEGLHVTVSEGPVREWWQPVIHQPEVGILALLAQEFDGVLHFLLQAKMEPGNPGTVQLSPTVQATRSNYTGVHRGRPVRYLDEIVTAQPGSVLVDVLQSEHGSWFYRKVNRNVVVETTGPVAVGDDFCWLTLGQLGALLREDNLVNMDTRTILGCLPTAPLGGTALLRDTELLSWIAGERARQDVHVSLVPLRDARGWRRGERVVDRPDGRYFRVVGVKVQAGSREIGRWSQPLIEPVGTGVAAFLVRDIDGVPHVLAHARAEGGFLDTVELGPTVQCVPESTAGAPPANRPLFLTEVLDAPPSRILYEAVHSEEGGRFLGAENRYALVRADAAVPADPPPGYCWVTPAQLNALTRHAHYVNVQARTLLAVLNAGWVSGM